MSPYNAKTQHINRSLLYNIRYDWRPHSSSDAFRHFVTLPGEIYTAYSALLLMSSACQNLYLSRPSQRVAKWQIRMSEWMEPQEKWNRQKIHDSKLHQSDFCQHHVTRTVHFKRFFFKKKLYKHFFEYELSVMNNFSWCTVWSSKCSENILYSSPRNKENSNSRHCLPVKANDIQERCMKILSA